MYLKAIKYDVKLFWEVPEQFWEDPEIFELIMCKGSDGTDDK